METMLAVSERAKSERAEYLSRNPLSPAFPLTIAAVALALAASLSPPSRSGITDPALLAAICARMDEEAVAAMARRRTEGPERGRQVHARTAPLWLAEARRSSTAGLDARAARFYGRITGWERRGPG